MSSISNRCAGWSVVEFGCASLTRLSGNCDLFGKMFVYYNLYTQAQCMSVEYNLKHVCRKFGISMWNRIIKSSRTMSIFEEINEC